MSKHTPGPWEYRNSVGAGLQIRGNPGVRDFLMFKSTGDGPVCLYTLRKESPKFDFADEIWVQFPQADWEEMQEANARLIAAAPDLLAACKAAKPLLAMWARHAGSPSAGESLEKITTAIAKATGATP